MPRGHRSGTGRERSRGTCRGHGRGRGRGRGTARGFGSGVTGELQETESQTSQNNDDLFLSDEFEHLNVGERSGPPGGVKSCKVQSRGVNPNNRRYHRGAPLNRGLAGNASLKDLPIQNKTQEKVLVCGRGKLKLIQKDVSEDVESVKSKNQLPDSALQFLKNYQILKSRRLKQYCLQNNMMYIMRGLPGSGKSTLANYIASQYKENEVIICSADHFRYDENGEYRWSPETLASTHKACQKKAREKCEAGTNVVIIDNTNHKIVDMQVYLNIANKYDYHVVIIEIPERNIKTLSSRTLHNVTENKINQMRNEYEPLVPYYISWEVGIRNTSYLKTELKKVVEVSLTYVPFQKFCDKNLAINLQNISTLFEVFHTKNSSSSTNMSHVTAAYLKEGDIPKSMNYLRNKTVSNTIGTLQDIKIIGWCITPKSVFGRVLLGNHQKDLWSRDDAFDEKKPKLSLESIFAFGKTALERKQKSYEPLFVKLDVNKDDDNVFKFSFFNNNFPEHYISPNFSVGSTAHLTVGVTNNNKPVKAKDDLVYILLQELNRAPNLSFEFQDHMLRCYDHNYWVMYLSKPIIVKALFCGAYPA